MRDEISITGLELLWNGRMVLGEGPLLDEAGGYLYFVDIKSNRLYCLNLKDRAIRHWQFTENISCVVPGLRPGTLRAAFRSGIGEIELESGTPSVSIKVPQLVPGQRFNDGKLDPHGGFWAGTMDDAETADIGVFYRILSDGTAMPVDDGYGVTNGPAFAPDGQTVYLTDSKARTIFRLRFDYQTGEVRDKEIFARLEGDEGYPDGMSCDRVGNLWVACWAGWRIICFNPDGSRKGIIKVPVERPTSLTFGADYKHLFVTSATIGLSAAALDAQPFSGGVFRIDL